jgi:Abscisic acid G-protein coupled receptor/The Golgi pH Regulator (GPHR) Family N-terminal
MIPTESDCDDCIPAYLKGTHSRAAFSTLPFILTFLFVAVIVHQKIYPLLSSPTDGKLNRSAYSPTSPRRDASTPSAAQEKRLSKQFSSLAFSSTIALSAVLTELLLCEISNSFDPATRNIAIRATVASLLCLLILVIPLLEIYSVVSGAGWRFIGGTKANARAAWILELAGFAIFLAGFWFIGIFLPYADEDGSIAGANLITACLERLGITGTLMMALLSGFAAVSAIWQNFAAKARLVSEADIDRKQAGLGATLDMLAGKKNRLRQVELKVSDAPSQGFFQKAMGSIRGNDDVQELKTLELEISGLRTMSTSLENSVSILQSRRASQLRSSTTIGRVMNGFSYLFSCYCVYRIGSTIINTTRRALHPNPSFTSTDPVTHVIALFARHIYPSLNQAAWSRQISFLLSGVILLASFNAVLQTFHLFARFLPGLLQATRSNMALLISQIAGLYVISSALMLRNMMPKDVGGVISDALGTGVLQPAWTERWFEGWFIGSVGVTAVGIWLSQKIKGDGVWDDEDDVWDRDIEMGKRL